MTDPIDSFVETDMIDFTPLRGEETSRLPKCYWPLASGKGEIIGALPGSFQRPSDPEGVVGSTPYF